MVVISGKYRGRKLLAPAQITTRPTSARVKEDMFNFLNNYFVYENKISLDLFAGSGALSIEGLSRGIKFAYMNDHNKLVLETIKKNFVGIPSEDYQLWNLDYDIVLQKMHALQVAVDLIYLDPPFARLDYYDNFFEKVINFNLLKPWGVIMTESPIELDVQKITAKGLTLLKHKDFKNKFFYLFRKEGD